MDMIRNQIGRRAAARQGLVTRSDLDELGVSRGRRRGLQADGTLETFGTKTFRVAGAPPSMGQDIMAACLETGGVASHRTAATLHGLWSRAPFAEVEVIAARPRCDQARSGVRIYSTTWLPKGDVVEVMGIPCTNVARTLFSLAGLVPQDVSIDVVRDAVDRAVRDGKATDQWLSWHFDRLRCRGRSGVSTYEEILEARRGGEITESWLEREFLRLLREAGLPLPECQSRIDRAGSFLARVDFHYPGLDLVIEVNGYEHHSTRSQAAADSRRRSELQLQGLRVLEFTYDQIAREPDYVIARVREALGGRP